MNILQRVEQATSWNNHLPLLYLALEETKTGAIVELGCGEGSTQWLHDYSAKSNRALFSYDSNLEYYSKYQHLKDSLHYMRLVEDWNKTAIDQVSVVLIDQAPGERRPTDALRYKDIKGIVVCHDTEDPPCGGNYGWNKAFPAYKYKVSIRAKSSDGIHNGVWATALSNHYDITQWIGKQFGQWEVEA